ncbi:MAG: hypothetical protein U1E81_16160 [Xanthobacteraceae bacterium]
MNPLATISKSFIRDRAVSVIRTQIRRIVDHSCDWLISPDLYRLAIVLREAANALDQAAHKRNGVGRRA